VSSPVSGSRTLKLTLLPVWEQGVGGMRGKSLPECRKPRIAPRNSTLESARVRRHPRTTWERGRLARTQPYRDGFFGKPLRTISRFRHQGAQIPPSPLVGEGGGSQGWMFWLAPAYYLLFQASERPNSPFSPCGRRGQGGWGQTRTGMRKTMHPRAPP